MDRVSPPCPRRPRRWVAVLALLAAVVATVGLEPAQAQPGGPPAAKPGKEEGVRWQDLKPAQREALKPLEREWPNIDASRKQKWIGVSSRYQKMSPDEQARMQGRMSEWAKLTPEQRGAARLHFQEAKQLPAQDRQDRWNAYQALPPEKKRELAERASPGSAASAHRPPAAGDAAERRAAREPAQAKSNIVPNPALSAPPKPVAPTVVRAGPGATTTLMSKRPAPPSHQQTGLPKIAATPEFVHRSTLLPQKGPQAAGTRPASSGAPGSAASR
jgi:hypothetical protein